MIYPPSVQRSIIEAAPSLKLARQPVPQAATQRSATSAYRNRILEGDCIDLMQSLPAQSVDFILTDPPYLVRYRDRNGRTVRNDHHGDWLEPAFDGMYRVLREGGFCVSFYGWDAIDQFMAAWRGAGFRIAGHIVFRKRYASSSRYLAHHHEQAYLLVKGEGRRPVQPLADVLDDWRYTGNRLHPTQKPVSVLEPLIESFTLPGDLVLDPFAGSGSTCVAAQGLGRAYTGMELDPQHCSTARKRLTAT